MDPTQQAIEDEKRRALDAIAAGETKVLGETQKATDAVAGRTQAAVQNALSESLARNAPSEMAGVLTKIIEGGTAGQQGLLAKAPGIEQTYYEALKPATAQYSDAAIAAEPKIRAEGELKRSTGRGGRGGRGGGRGGRGGGGGGSGNHQYWWDWFYENGLNKIYGGGKEGKAAFKNDLKVRASQGFTGPGGRTWTTGNSPGWARRQKLASLEAPGSERWAAGNFAPPTNARKAMKFVQQAAAQGATAQQVQAHLREQARRGAITSAGAKYFTKEFKRERNRARRGR